MMMMEPVQGPRFCKTHVSASCSETVAEKPPAAQPLQRLPCILFPPWEVIIALALERRACFLSPPLLCGGRSSACSEHKGPVQEGGGIMLYTIQSLLYCCCGLPSLNWGGAPFFKVGKLLARQRRLHLPKSLDENVKGERVCVCLCVVCERAELNYNLTFLSSGLCSVKEQLIQRVCAPENISDKACPQTQKSVYGNISTRFPQSNSQTHHSPAEGGDKSRRWETRSVWLNAETVRGAVASPVPETRNTDVFIRGTSVWDPNYSCLRTLETLVDGSHNWDRCGGTFSNFYFCLFLSLWSYNGLKCLWRQHIYCKDVRRAEQQMLTS